MLVSLKQTYTQRGVYVIHPHTPLLDFLNPPVLKPLRATVMSGADLNLAATGQRWWCCDGGGTSSPEK